MAEEDRKEKVLVLRTCNADLSASYDPKFKWPEAGDVAAPDWDPEPCCGYGLHGLLWGEGDGGLLNWEPSARWLVVAVEAAEIVELDGKVKFPRGVVVHCGDQQSATQYIHTRRLGAIVGLSATAGDRGTATAGDRGTATAGNRGTATAGDRGTATAGAGGTATAGDYGIATAGNRGTATAGDYGIATAGAGGTATAGDYGIATAGDYGIATAGEGGTATAGDYGIATAGEGGTLILNRYDYEADRRRIVIAYVGEDGIEAGKAYRLNETGKVVLTK